MQKHPLSTCYGWRGRAYGPGLVAIPDDLAIALNLTAPESAPAAEPAPAPEPEPDKAEQRRTQLHALYRSPDGGYQAIKELSVKYELGDKAPPGGWDEAIAGIVAYEVEHDLL